MQNATFCRGTRTLPLALGHWLKLGRQQDGYWSALPRWTEGAGILASRRYAAACRESSWRPRRAPLLLARDPFLLVRSHMTRPTLWPDLLAGQFLCADVNHMIRRRTSSFPRSFRAFPGALTAAFPHRSRWPRLLRALGGPLPPCARRVLRRPRSREGAAGALLCFGVNMPRKWRSACAQRPPRRAPLAWGSLGRLAGGAPPLGARPTVSCSDARRGHLARGGAGRRSESRRPA